MCSCSESQRRHEDWGSTEIRHRPVQRVWTPNWDSSARKSKAPRPGSEQLQSVCAILCKHPCVCMYWQFKRKLVHACACGSTYAFISRCLSLAMSLAWRTNLHRDKERNDVTRSGTVSFTFVKSKSVIWYSNILRLEKRMQDDVHRSFILFKRHASDTIAEGEISKRKQGRKNHRSSTSCAAGTDDIIAHGKEQNRMQYKTIDRRLAGRPVVANLSSDLFGATPKSCEFSKLSLTGFEYNTNSRSWKNRSSASRPGESIWCTALTHPPWKPPSSWTLRSPSRMQSPWARPARYTSAILHTKPCW